MGAFLRFTLFVAALCLAAVLGYAAGVRNADPGADHGTMTIDTGEEAESATLRSATPKDPVAPEPGAANAAAQDAGAKSTDATDAGATRREPEAPTSIDEILQKHASQPPPAN